MSESNLENIPVISEIKRVKNIAVMLFLYGFCNEFIIESRRYLV